MQIYPNDKKIKKNVKKGPGEVHGLVGENGAGKSTIIKVLAGVYQPAEGRIEVGGSTISPATPEKIRDAGVRFIHQPMFLMP